MARDVAHAVARRYPYAWLSDHSAAASAACSARSPRS
eukprot:CAMPEP_0198346680 /NCGR_PEP_ID=MMETSP1450-20131203/81026_1 /TAXON_ID=753684 ORGANISM="Madagascaria erythrocladiodes, Strain CCMP3234" /NCGR_SAMPLE_ID=MMETSP1450 /ASSEMBLY_ACC=CAM_ASM_001115 /LENGTH=36 /DNA_ID= /DNA_START= /DNA_END= /DNA_ORIENTATION=